MKKIVSTLFNNFGWKLTSLLVAIALWFFVVNITNPMSEKNSQVMLQIVGEDTIRENNYVILNLAELQSTSVNLMIRDSASSLAQINKSEEVKATAYIDLTPIDISHSLELGKRNPIRVKYELTGLPGANVKSISPEEVHIVLDRYITKIIPVTVNKIGEDKEGFITLDPVATPAEVLISGPLSVVSTVSEVSAEVDVSDHTEGFRVTKPLVVLNADGRDISKNLDLSIQEAEIAVSVEKFAKIPVIVPETTGAVMNGYRVTSVEIIPDKIEVEGNSRDIKAMPSIKLMPVDISGIDKTKIEVFDLRAYLADANLNIRDGSPSQVRAIISVEKEVTREISVPINKIEILGMTGGVTLPMDDVSIELTGIESEIEEFESSDYLAYIDITNVAEGTHTMPVRLELPAGIRISSGASIDVTIAESHIES